MNIFKFYMIFIWLYVHCTTPLACIFLYGIVYNHKYTCLLFFSSFKIKKIVIKKENKTIIKKEVKVEEINLQ